MLQGLRETKNCLSNVFRREAAHSQIHWRYCYCLNTHRNHTIKQLFFLSRRTTTTTAHDFCREQRLLNEISRWLLTSAKTNISLCVSSGKPLTKLKSIESSFKLIQSFEIEWIEILRLIWMNKCIRPLPQNNWHTNWTTSGIVNVLFDISLWPNKQINSTTTTTKKIWIVYG